MTPQQIRDAISASPEMRALAEQRNDGVLAAALAATLPPIVENPTAAAR